ncbi:RNA-binding protein [Formosa sp. Hel3_A1_48]|jgi:ribosome-associated heat shock protein Hsp15|uniref:RNA-binding S4 domain-containing protein n=1 Tax=Formosa sp. Hel3_A1_48 TaxID=1336795 RepID=UPI00084E1E9E|nr:S4 domain-containing protein [Formosa sp. Hel3_A1_48]MDA9846371.1 S4 domain-containing protein [Flavobacteriaceae bacterium]NCF42280.1 RNA-binding S4 domain-containing protein [Bacteroidota bacterium]AOR25768.1 RNA-binding protein [Formosa sp. Hel3_A1_48]MDC0950633.1 S4 domain-containing protein [Flavobacteriaceae bacterium]MDG1673711.1 S4 domain-containing protein [Flavobacteriaceae bacterium]|tara:strand:+ start:1200 stop:1574 length:375 start_codon:yes stop_codon:yes gene_type:complete
MRIDKFLWCLRYFKTRTIASNATKKGQVRVNESIVKPSREVYPTDEINVRINQVNYRMTVLDLPKSRVGAKLVDQYRQDTTPKSEFEAKELLKLAKEHYRKKGEGRPTKKDRRDIEGYLDFDKN